MYVRADSATRAVKRKRVASRGTSKMMTEKRLKKANFVVPNTNALSFSQGSQEDILSMDAVSSSCGHQEL